jgi:hypothetical protein
MAETKGKRGNPNRCKVCGRLGGADGYCKKHRGQRNKSHDPFRDNFIEGWGFVAPGEMEEFGIMSDFPHVSKWNGAKK